MGLEKFLRHGRRHAVAQTARERGENDRRVHVALVIGGENHRLIERTQVLFAFDANPGEEARERQDPGR